MADISAAGLAALGLLAGVIAFCVLWILGLALRKQQESAIQDPPFRIDSTFLFRDGILTDQDATPLSLPGTAEREIACWDDLRSWFGGRFGPLPDRLDEIRRDENRHFRPVDPKDRAALDINAAGGAHRVVLTDPQTDAAALHRVRLLETAFDRLDSVLHDAPCAIHVSDAGGQTIWQNALFARFDADEVASLQQASTGAGRDRLRLPGDGPGDSRHFELLRKDGNGITVLYATDVTKVVQAERVRREFVQTLTKTFANLTTGLAVFDRQKQLALFNPALLDLTGLPATFLSGRPTLAEVFDRLRDRKVLPEPKNYCDWRAQINAMVASAVDGLYLEDWSLPNGLTYRVTGRPHPDGAIAFLFEDISDEITLTRRFRSQLDLRQAVLDTMDSAIAVIGSNNVVVLCNRACSDLLGIDPDTSFAEMSLADFLRACRGRLSDVAAWSEAEGAISGRKPLSQVIRAGDGKAWSLGAKPLAGNAVMISISIEAAIEPTMGATLPA